MHTDTQTGSGQVSTIPIGFHGGNILLYISQLYSHPTDAIRECVQNAIDKRAKHIRIQIDCLQSTIHVIDDGDGADLGEITAKFNAIGKSLKLADPEAIGEKGIGNLAGIAIAEVFELVTRDTKSSDPFRIYTLDRDKVRGKPSAELVTEVFPAGIIMKGLGFTPSAVVRLRGVNAMALKRLRDIEAVTRCLADAFSGKIRAQNIDVRVNYRDLQNRRSERRVAPISFR